MAGEVKAVARVEGRVLWMFEDMKLGITAPRKHNCRTVPNHGCAHVVSLTLRDEKSGVETTHLKTKGLSSILGQAQHASVSEPVDVEGLS